LGRDRLGPPFFVQFLSFELSGIRNADNNHHHVISPKLKTSCARIFIPEGHKILNTFDRFFELEQAKRELQTARLNLAAQWGEKREFPAVMGNLEQVSKLPPLESLNAKLHGNANLARWTTEHTIAPSSGDAFSSQKMPRSSLVFFVLVVSVHGD